MLLVDDKWTDTVKPLRKSIIETKGSQRNWGSPAVVSGWLIKRGRHRKAPTTHSSPHIVSWNVSMGYTLSMRVVGPSPYNMWSYIFDDINHVDVAKRNFSKAPRLLFTELSATR